jgi:hypothetical protein
LDANQAVSFFADIWNFDNTDNVQSISLANDKTQEKLVIYLHGEFVFPFGGIEFVRIARYPMAKEEHIKKLQTMTDGLEEWIWTNHEERKIEVNLNIKSGYFTRTRCSLI